ncbi:basic amino acid ABC transporter substrate-binding protein [Neobacillus kokaensis]|uniref:Basic amino acid ABC transporter substrate-binding protein n=1 Tax=Neobacillus kokaensis TaxID=2759023 RepID=A0ABQ3N6C4_9BACI|nr:basic amino acid ABC transporter substrate-binding protein [Neobacillus kokaensis]GHH99405.1 basic amino acid ABC transporter substrate-binding protein [Neobacillus kokaensis]
MKGKFSRITFLVLSICLVIFTSACGKESAGTSSEQKEKTLLVGTDAVTPPFVFMDKGKIVGFDVDLISAILDEAGYKSKVENVGWDPLFTQVESGEVDIGITSITITDDRKQTYDFADPYFESKLMILAKEGTDIKNAMDLKGKKVGVQNATTGQFALEKIVGKNNPSIFKYETLGVAFMALKNGDIEAVITDNTVANEYVKNNPNDKFVAISDDVNFDPEYYGILLKKGSKLSGEINQALKTVIDNGTYTKIYEKWFGISPDIEVIKSLSTVE